MRQYPTAGAKFSATHGISLFDAILEEVPDAERPSVAMKAHRLQNMGWIPSQAAERVVSEWRHTKN